jgi:catalase
MAMISWPDFKLYRREAWKFDPDGPDKERAEFVAHEAVVRQVQDHLAAKSGGPARRVFHAKSHGCLLGELRLLPDREKVARQGIFADEASTVYPVLARFSNGKGTIEADVSPDVRGVALKIFKTRPQSQQTVDFLMTNSRVAFGKDHAEFVEFMEASKDGLPGPTFAARHPRVIFSLIKCIFQPHSVCELTYGSGHAYLLGQNRAMKMKLEPHHEHQGFFDAAAAKFHLIEDRDFLRHELEQRASTKGVRFTLSVQLETEDELAATPIEDALFEWSEETSPPLPVAELVFDAQTVTDARREYVDTLSFNPWDYHPDHRPLGNLARGRLFSYAASREGRGSRQVPSFDEFLVEWRNRGDQGPAS